MSSVIAPAIMHTDTVYNYIDVANRFGQIGRAFFINRYFFYKKVT